MNYLSSSITQIELHYDVVIVGSGYGGAIAASRFARAGKKVCVLERGKEFQAGDFPNSIFSALPEIQVDYPAGGEKTRQGSRIGLFDFRCNKDVNVFVGCGLGGTSLINANVAMRADKSTFNSFAWPEEFRNDVDGLLQESYQHAEDMLKPEVYPDQFPALSKFKALARSSSVTDSECEKLPINVNFSSGENHVGIHQNACVLCGDCITGCNFGAKNTLTTNYLPDAFQHGAKLMTQVDVRHVEQKKSRWHVHYQVLRSGKEKFDSPTLFVSADVVWLSAGTLGSTEILMRSKEKGLPISNQLGKRFSGNGDYLGFAYNCDQSIASVGKGDDAPLCENPVGPCIIGGVKLEREDKSKSIIIQDGAMPSAISLFLPYILSRAAKMTGRDTDSGFFDRVKEKLRVWLSFIRGAYYGAIKNTQTYLVMSHDSSGGEMKFENNRVRVSWDDVNDQEIHKDIDNTLYNMTKILGGMYVKSPTEGDRPEDRYVTVHPLGGCAMADNASLGVVDHRSRVFSTSKGTAVHAGLYVCDGSIIPSSIGVNPLLTISAVSERAVKLLADDKGWIFNYDFKNVDTSEFADRSIGIEFDETMRGFLAGPETGDYQQAFETGKSLSNLALLNCTVVIDDLDKFMQDRALSAWLTGSFRCAAINKSPMAIEKGEFNLFVEDHLDPRAKKMTYKMILRDEHGKQFYFDGYKAIKDDPGFDSWDDTTTLFVVVYAGSSNTGIEVARGIVNIKVKDLYRQLKNIRVIGAKGIGQRLTATSKFGRFFAGEIFDMYGGIFASKTYFDPNAAPRQQRDLRVNPPEVIHFKTEDQTLLKLTHYKGGRKGPVLLIHGLGVSSRIFSLDTINTNLTEYLVQNQYDVWLLDLRSSIDLSASNLQFTLDTLAQQDMPAAVSKVLELTGHKTLQAVAHCAGSNALVMSLLNGLQGVRSMVCSQTLTDFYTPKLTRLKAGLFMPGLMKLTGIKSLNAYVDENSDWKQKLLDMALRFHPLESEERCQNANCHRITFMYGHLYEHDKLNTATHNTLHELFGIANISTFEHLALMIRKKKLVNDQGQDTYMKNLKNLRLPTLILHGEENACYLPKSTEKSLFRLIKVNGNEYYQREIIPDYGHIDCIIGANASDDVYPYIVKHLDAN